MSSVIHAQLLTNRRAVDRAEAGRVSTIRQEDRIPVDMIIDDLSCGGCRVSGELGLEEDDRVTIGLPGVGIRTAQVVWSKDGSTGLVFDIPLTGEDIIVARKVDTLIDGRFTMADPMPDAIDEGEALSPSRRLGIIIGAAVFAWCVTIIAIMMAIRLF